MARGQGGRGRARGGGPKRGGAGAGGGHQSGSGTSNMTLATRVAKPAVRTLPEALQVHPTNEEIPSLIEVALREEYGIRNAQPFFSALERLQPEVATHGRLETCWCGISGEMIAAFEYDDEDTFKGALTLTDQTEVPLYIKRVHLVDPIQAIEGECVWPREGALPAPTELWLNTLDKVNDPMNEAYVDAVFALIADRLVTTGVSPHWCKCFGTFAARVEKYLYNISDEYSSLRNKTFWSRNQRLGLFGVHKEVPDETEAHTRSHKDPLEKLTTQAVFSEDADIELGDFDVLETPVETNTTSAAKNVNTNIGADVEEMEDDMFEVDDTPLVVDRHPVQIRRIEGSGSTASESEESETDDDEDYMDVYAEFTDFPVQVTLLERVEGTLDDLLDAEWNNDDEKEEHWKAWLFQIIAALSTAQYLFGFVHNDLHSQNVMWSRTEKTHVVYRVQNTRTGKHTYYQVPTYGYIMKIIDFGRATYTLPEPAGFFISDAFFPGNDAAQQYNCEPFFDVRNGKRVEPNPSFDLCRLAVSLLESIWSTRPANATPIKLMSREGPKSYAETVSPLYNLLWEWLTDDAGKNILRTPAGDERYPEFDLYSAIAADVHRAVPFQQIEKTIFAGYRLEGGVDTTDPVYDLHV